MKKKLFSLCEFVIKSILYLDWRVIFLGVALLVLIPLLVVANTPFNPQTVLLLSLVLILLGVIGILYERCEAMKKVHSLYRELYEIKNAEVDYSLEKELDSASKDREHLLLLIANSFKKAHKLKFEKKTPTSTGLILVFQLKNGNLRFSIPEASFPESLRNGTTIINTDKINYKNNYRLVRELIGVENG